MKRMRAVADAGHQGDSVPRGRLVRGSGDGVSLLFGFGGRPPRLPFSREAAAFADERVRPPFLPRATAWGFLRGMGGLSD